MANLSITWEPALLTGTLQVVEYKESTSSTWITIATLPKTASNYIITGINKEKIYNVRIGSNCNNSGLVYSPIITIGDNPPTCEDRVLVFQICNANAIPDDDFNIYLNDELIGSVELGSFSQVGSIFIASEDETIEVEEPDFVCSVSNMDTFYFSPSLLKKDNVIRMENIQNNGYSNYGTIGIRNYRLTDNGLEDPCIVANLDFIGPESSDFNLNFQYTTCCQPYDEYNCYVGIITTDGIIENTEGQILPSGYHKCFRALGAPTEEAIRRVKELEVNLKVNIPASSEFGILYGNIGKLNNPAFFPTSEVNIQPLDSTTQPGLTIDVSGNIRLFIYNNLYTGSRDVVFSAKKVEWNTSQEIECNECIIKYDTQGEATNLCATYITDIELGLLIKSQYQNATYTINTDTINFVGTSNSFLYTIKKEPGRIDVYSREAILASSLNFPINSVTCNIRILSPNVGGRNMIARLYKNNTLISSTPHISTLRNLGDPSLVVPFSFTLSTPLIIDEGDIIHIEHDFVEETPTITNSLNHVLAISNLPVKTQYRFKITSEIIDMDNTGYGNHIFTHEAGPYATSTTPVIPVCYKYPNTGVSTAKTSQIVNFANAMNNEQGTSDGGLSFVSIIDFKKIMEDNSVNKVYYRLKLEKISGPNYPGVARLGLYNGLTLREDCLFSGGIYTNVNLGSYSISHELKGWVKKNVLGGYDIYYESIKT